jgi:hypothetical protein
VPDHYHVVVFGYRKKAKNLFLVTGHYIISGIRDLSCGYLLKPAMKIMYTPHKAESVLIGIKRSVSDQMYGLLSTDKKNADIVLDMDICD